MADIDVKPINLSAGQLTREYCLPESYFSWKVSTPDERPPLFYDHISIDGCPLLYKRPLMNDHPLNATNDRVIVQNLPLTSDFIAPHMVGLRNKQ